MDAERARTVAVVGAGTIGPGIALAFLLGGLEVHLVDVAEAQLARAGTAIETALSLLAEEGVVEHGAAAEQIRGRLVLTADLAAAAARADFIEEAVPEDPAVKRILFGQLERHARPDVWLGSNTSTLRLSEFTAELARPERVVGMHWVAPPYITPAVEVVRGDRTSPEAVAFARDLLARIGKVPVVVGDIPGFIINRLQQVLQTEAFEIVGRGAATVEDVDTAFRYSLALRYPLWGILGTHDRSVNKRTSMMAATHLSRMAGDPKFGPAGLLEQKVAEGALGIWSGRGWYDYSGRDLQDLLRERDATLLRMIRTLREQRWIGDSGDAPAGPNTPPT